MSDIEILLIEISVTGVFCLWLAWREVEMVRKWIPGFFSSYWKRRCLAVEQQLDQLEVEVSLLRSRIPLKEEERRRRILGAEFHSEIGLK